MTILDAITEIVLLESEEDRKTILYNLNGTILNKAKSQLSPDLPKELIETSINIQTEYYDTIQELRGMYVNQILDIPAEELDILASNLKETLNVLIEDYKPLYTEELIEVIQNSKISSEAKAVLIKTKEILNHRVVIVPAQVLDIRLLLSKFDSSAQTPDWI